MTKCTLLYFIIGLTFGPILMADDQCPTPKQHLTIDSLVKQISKIASKNGGGPPDISIREVNYPKNANAEYCLRSMLIADTIVFHHSASPETDTAETINSYHLQRGTAHKPWHMIAYHFAINSAYEGSPGNFSTQVSRGRPEEMIGAHAGVDAFTNTLTPAQKEVIEKTGINCGKMGGTFSPKTDIFNPQGKTKINNTSIGIVFIGNYSPFSANNPSGFPVNRPRFPAFDSLELAARLICHLQKSNPGLKKITYHGKFRQTSCPGLVKDKLTIIKNIAEKYGCAFNLQ